ncbi:biotin/lipoyl-binding carrier protein [Saccharomonospora piscinae]|uniref:Acetyl-CoA carboxylase biotin carboxyl carrier protein subunit n=1 Tax=Saccharomonospora piscinae TaxID=687388 RepID=A0A1V8ZY21_SACPI|nr:biotin/lipoyl-binding carrier protein [Saccharomonospora piscinae]OQO89698.1 acetyl-CoA carboxylase biotin carboxyl carrier protein subunit [Saccharomonospora piscinae]TLW91377.1 biotin/lipoyl-binding carrier protein [Saccharomonospora piscinae]
MHEEIKAEIVASVLSVFAAEGDVLAEGDEIVLLESMKMEIPVITEQGGTLVRVSVTEGQSVAEGDLLALVANTEDTPRPA